MGYGQGEESNALGSSCLHTNQSQDKEQEQFRVPLNSSRFPLANRAEQYVLLGKGDEGHPKEFKPCRTLCSNNRHCSDITLSMSV